MSDILVADNPAESRYEISVDGELGGILAYGAAGTGERELQHTLVLPSHRGQGLASRLVAGAFDDLRARGDRAVVSCPYILGWLPEHPEVADLVVGELPPAD